MHGISSRFCALVSLGLAALPHAQPLLNVNFENRALGPYTERISKADFPSATYREGLDEGRTEIVLDPIRGNKVMKSLFPAGCVGPNTCGTQIKVEFKTTADTAYVRYLVRFDEGFEWVKGGKLPGLCGKDCITGGLDPDGTNGWSARLMWRDSGKVNQYVYFPEKADPNHPGFGEDMPYDRSATRKRFIPGKWHEVINQIAMNTPGQRNGIVRAWFDGELALERTDILFRTIADMHVDKLYISTFHGGKDSTWAPSGTHAVYFDDFLVTTHAAEVGLKTPTTALRRPHPANRPWDMFYGNLRRFSLDGKILE
ncbi:MAG: polysaccharide lyase [Fibrobacterota bacterium]|nr:polysaccharide lyase [Fibrobacterota bacterium]